MFIYFLLNYISIPLMGKFWAGSDEFALPKEYHGYLVNCVARYTRYKSGFLILTSYVTLPSL